jgi:hypothetical protein
VNKDANFCGLQQQPLLLLSASHLGRRAGPAFSLAERHLQFAQLFPCLFELRGTSSMLRPQIIKECLLLGDI